eukprot:1335731-Amorphochlora_amoeboformis.AAC.1
MDRWKRFQFFDLKPVTEANGKSSLRVFRDFEPSCSCGGQDTNQGYLVYGDSRGVIRVLDGEMKLQNNFQAFKESVVALGQPTKYPETVFVALGHDTIEHPTLKFFAFGKKDEKGNSAEVVLRELAVTCRGGPPPPATATTLAIMPELSQVAVGTEQGTVFLVSGDVLKRPQVSILREKGFEVTGLHYLAGENIAAPSLFVVTARTVDSYFIQNRNFKVSLEKEAGGQRECSVADVASERLLVGRDKAVYRWV